MTKHRDAIVTIGMMWKHLLKIIYTINLISCGSCFPAKKTSSNDKNTNIRVNREVLERQHCIHYLGNEAIYRNWPEVKENPNHDCQRFLQKVLPTNKDLTSVISRIRKVILNYNQIRDGDTMLIPKRITALECEFPTTKWNRKFVYFIRSPQSPKCALLLNRMAKQSFNFYIVEDICENINYPNIRLYVAELEEDKVKGCTPNDRRKKLLLSGEEIKIKRAEFEKKHYEYCTINSEVCKLWPDVQEIPELQCKRFFKRIMPTSLDLSLVTARRQQVTLHYIEINNEIIGRLDPLDVYAVACRLPLLVLGRRYIYFIRAPSYPDCVFYIFRKMPSAEHFYITEEICDSHYQTNTMNQIIFENGGFRAWKDSLRKRKKSDLVKEDASSKRFYLQQSHYDAFKHNKESFTMWPETQSTPAHVCKHFLQGILTIENGLSLITGAIHQVTLYYTEIQDQMNNQKIEPLILSAVQCRLHKPLKGFKFVYLLRSPSYPDCTFLLSRLQNRHNKFYISEEICESKNFISSHKIISSASQNALRNQRVQGDTIEKREEYERLHLQYYIEQQNDSEKWQELEQINKKDVCRIFLISIYPRAVQKCNIEAETKPLHLKYCLKKKNVEEGHPPQKVKTLVCTVPGHQPPNRFHFIRTLKPYCVYWAKRFQKSSQYFIAKEICVTEPQSSKETNGFKH